MDCAKVDPYRPVWTNRCRWLAAVLWLGTGFMDGALCWGQRDSAATESEWSETTSDRLRGDVHRDDDLAGLPAMEATLYGREHLSRFLTSWYSLLFDLQPDSPSANPIEVVHFGGSHVQAGRIGWAFRQRLSEDRPGIAVGCGIQVPHRLMDSNGPPDRGWSSPEDWSGQSCANRRHQAPWGITGIEAQSPVAAPVACWSGSPAGERCVSEIRILSRPDSALNWRPVLPQPWKPDLAALSSAGIAHWISPAGGAAPDTLILQPAAAGAQALHGVEWVPQNAGFVFHDLGANGANSTSWMRNPHFKEQLRNVAPDLTILAWGINDAHMSQSRFDAARFSRHYGALIDTIRSAHPDTEILLVTNNDSHYRHRHNPNAEDVRAAMLNLVAERGVACWDLYGHLGGKGSIDALNGTGFAASDRLHFRRDGYILIGELLYELLVRAAIQHSTPAP
jgi:lysophospholipase L1-like esterase